MLRRTDLLNRTVRAIVWLLVTAGVAFLVGRAAANTGAPASITAPLPPVSLDQRATVSLAEASIVPVVSADGHVIRDGTNWLLEAPAAPDELAYRLLDPPVAVKALINGGPVGFDCAWAGLGQSGVTGGGTTKAAIDLPADASGVTMRCAIPNDVRVAAGMTGKMVLRMGQPATVQALPVTAVVGSAGTGQVVVVRGNGATEIRAVQLGISDIYNIQVTGGLDPSEKVLRVPTQADFAQSGSSS